MFNLKLKEAKNEIGKFIFILSDTLTKEEIECGEEELCDLAIKGEIVGLEKLKGGCVSQLLLPIMVAKGGEYSVTSKFEKYSSSKIAGYEFEDSFKNKYILRLQEALVLVGEYGSFVKNAQLNNSQKYLISKDGSDLRKIKKDVVYPQKYLTEAEFKEFIRYWEELRKAYERGELTFR